MHLGIVQASFATALGLVSIGALGLGVTSGNSSAISNETVVVTQELQQDESESVTEIEIPNQTADSPPRGLAAGKEVVKKLAELDVRLQAALQRFGPSHPDVKSLRGQIELLEKYEQESATAASGKKTSTTLQETQRLTQTLLRLEQAKTQYMADHPKVKSLQAKANSLMKRIGKLATEKEIAEVNPVHVAKQQLMACESQLIHTMHRFGPEHPQVAMLKKQVEMAESALRTAKENSPEAQKDLSKMKKIFGYKPVQKGATYSQPKSFDLLDLHTSNASQDQLPGFEVTDVSGNTLRRMLDFNRDDNLDTWIYFNFGRETYRDVDTDFDGKADEAHFIYGDKIRIGKDKDQDGTIDSWTEKRLSNLGR